MTAGGAAFWVWQRGTTQPGGWVVSEVRDGQRTLVVEWWPSLFKFCDQRPSLKVEELPTEIRLRSSYRTTRGIECGLQRGQRHRPAFVRLGAPLAGRRITGPGQATVPATGPVPLPGPPLMPSVIGMDAAAARLALSRARYWIDVLPSAETPGSVVRQRPRAGSVLRYENRGYGASVAGRPRLTFETVTR